MDAIAAVIDDEYGRLSSEDDDRESFADSDDWGQFFLDPGSHLRAGKQALGLTRNYVPDWSPRDAFREFVQNWKDDIIDKNSLEPDQFVLDLEHTKDAYIATIRAPGPDTGGDHTEKGAKKLRGFIRYSKRDGTLQLTNFNSSLTRAALGLGFTTKRNKENLAGTHGEGFKVASLVMVNKGYQVRIEASRFYWKFRYFANNPNNLYCVLSAASEKKIQKDMEKERIDRAKGVPRGLTANIWEDVTVKIGKVYRPWSESASIKQEEFDSWLKASLDLEPPSSSDVIKTSRGSLILDPKFQGRIYLRDLLLEINDPLATFERKFRFAYNLMLGRVNRDRQSLSSSAQEAEGFAMIWKEAIQKEPDVVFKNYIEMLREDDRWADVSRAKDYMDENMARAVWQYHLREDPEHKKFYYDRKTRNHDVGLIRKSLKKEPVPMSSSIWEPLRRWALVRTPQEQQHHLLQNAPVAVVTETMYSLGVRRAFCAALAVDKRTRELSVSYRSGNPSGLDLLINKPHLLIHERCLDFYTAHEANPCRLARLSSTRDMKIEYFSCDHIVMDLYELVLDEIMKDSEPDVAERESTFDSLYLQVSESLREMPRKIEVYQGAKTGEIDVSWADFTSDMDSRLHGLDVKGRIILHRESTCHQKRFELLASQEIIECNSHQLENDGPIQSCQSTADCGCPEQIVSQKSSRTTFSNLDLSQEYFPMVARINFQAFFGLPPPAVRPKGREEKSFIEPLRGSSLGSRSSRQKFVKTRYDNEDIYDVSDGDENSMQVDMPYRGSPSQRPSASAQSTNLPNDVTPNNSPNSTFTQVIPPPQMPRSPSLFKDTSETARLQDKVKILSEQLNEIKRRLKSSNEDLERTTAKLKQLQIDSDLKDQKLQAKNEELRTASKQARDQSQALIGEAQSLRQTHKTLNEQLREKEVEYQHLWDEIQTLQEINAGQHKKLQELREESLNRLRRLEDAEKLVGILSERNEGNEHLPRPELESHDVHAACTEEIERLARKVSQLRETRDLLKEEVKEARKDAREGHASTREALRHMMSLHETRSQLPDTIGRNLPGETSRSTSSGQVKRESLDEGESDALLERRSKRIKQERIIDLTN